MAVYKVIQDIEAEDKLFGPLTLKSFVYAAIAAILTYINVRLISAGGPLIVRLLIIFVLFLPSLLFGLLASPLGRQQPTEVWLLAHLKFWVKPRSRVWDQSGLKQLVTITVPKRVDKQLTKGFSQVEVRSRLQALASTLDSRGWAIKNISINTDAVPGYLDGSEGDSDRLIGTSSLHQDAAVVDVRPSDDILDEDSNATAQNFSALVREAEAKRKKEFADKMNMLRKKQEEDQRKKQEKALAERNATVLDQTKPADKQPPKTTFVGKAVVAPTQQQVSTVKSIPEPTASAEQQLLDKKHREEAEIESKMPKNFNPRARNKPGQKPLTAEVTPQAQAAKLELAQSGNDLSVASIAQLANRGNQMEQVGPNEFVMSLH